MQLKFKSTLFLIGVREASHVFASKNCSLCSHGLLGILPKPLGYGKTKKEIYDLKAIRVNVRITVFDYLRVSENAATMGVSIPDFIRLKTTGRVLPRKRITPEDRKLFVEMCRIGNNINQLTKKVHLGENNPPQLSSLL